MRQRNPEKVRQLRQRPIRESLALVRFDPDRFAEDMRRPRSKKSYVIFFIARAGSSWLSDLLKNTGLLGEPAEWFNPTFIGRTAAALNADTDQRYLEMLQRLRISENGVFGMKMSFAHMQALQPVDILEQLGADARVFYLRRRDIGAQALSLARALSTDVFAIRDNADAGAAAAATPEADIPDVLLQRMIRHLVRHEADFAAYFSRKGVDPIPLYYEELVADPQAILDSFADTILGLQGGTIVSVSDFRKLAPARDGERMAQFRGRNAGFWQEALARRPAFASRSPTDVSG